MQRSPGDHLNVGRAKLAVALHGAPRNIRLQFTANYKLN
jgi:hypothetical protein